MGAHFLLLPYTEQGHITPMLSLASQLASLDCKVTFVKTANQTKGAANTPPPAAAATAADSALLRFVTLLDAPKHESSVSMSSRYSDLTKTLADLEERQARIEEIVQESKASAHPISCIVCDLLFWKWVKQLASRQSLHFAVLVTSSALIIYTGLLGYNGKDSESEELLISSFGMPVKNDLRRFGIAGIRAPPEVKNRMINFISNLVGGIEDANAHILVNSFKQLEAPLLPSLEASCLNVRFIGPCFPSWNEDVGMANKMAQQAGSAFIQDGTCLPWLDRQQNRSVLYISFGSEGILDKEQVEELAMGIESSRHKFLWVVRPDAPASSRPPEDFRRRCSERGNERGMFVSWVPQRKVLQHRAVGGFLTHSGWNSTLESVAVGVPMLCLPLIADQPFNANLVERYWRVGMRLATSEERVAREEVERGVRAVMEGRYSQRVSQLQQAAQLATLEARQTLASFVHDLQISTPGRILKDCQAT